MCEKMSAGRDPSSWEGVAEAEAEAAADPSSRDALHRRKSGFGIPSTAHELHHAKLRWEEESWQVKALHFINSHAAQTFFVCLLVLDVLILFAELELDANFPHCRFISRDGVSCCPGESDAHGDGHGGRVLQRLLSDAHSDGHHSVCAYPLVDTQYAVGCNTHQHHAVHVAHEVLFWTTVAILVTFEMELLSLIYLLGPRQFLATFMYVLDLFIVTVSLALELAFHFSREELAEMAGILILFRLWRFVRIGHGLVASTYEVQEHRAHEAHGKMEELERKLAEYEGGAPEEAAA